MGVISSLISLVSGAFILRREIIAFVGAHRADPTLEVVSNQYAVPLQPLDSSTDSLEPDNVDVV